MAAATRAGPARALPRYAVCACVRACVRAHCAHASEAGTSAPPTAWLARPSRRPAGLLPFAATLCSSEWVGPLGLHTPLI